MNLKMRLFMATVIVAFFTTNPSDSERPGDFISPSNASIVNGERDQRAEPETSNNSKTIAYFVVPSSKTKQNDLPLRGSAKTIQSNQNSSGNPEEFSENAGEDGISSSEPKRIYYPSIRSIDMDAVVTLKANSDSQRETLPLVNFISKLDYENSSGHKLERYSPLITSQHAAWLEAEASLENLLKYIIESHLKHCDLIIAVDRSFRESRVLESLVESPALKQIVLVKSPEDLALLVEWESNHCKGTILLVSDPEPLIDFGSNYKFQWAYKAKVVIVGLTLKSLETFLLTMKGKKTEHIIGVVKDDNSQHFKIFMNLLFWGQGMEQITTWWGQRFTRKADLFPDKISNLRGSVIKACMFDVRPLIYYLRDKNGNIIGRDGRDTVVARELSEIFNFTLVYVDIDADWGTPLPNGTFTGLVGFLERDEGQMGLAYLYSTALDDRHKHHEYSHPMDDDKTCFLARISPPLPAWQNLGLPFQADTWIAFIIGLFLSGPIFYALVMASSSIGEEDRRYKSLAVSSLNTFAMHFSYPMEAMPKLLSTQIFIAFLLLYTFILSVGYRANLTSFLTVARTPKKIDTFKDLYDSGISIKGFQWFYNAFNHSGNFYLRKLLERYEIRDTFEEIVKDIMSGGSATINSKALLEMASTLMRTKRGKPLVRFLKECLSTYSVGIGFQLHSPLKPKFDGAIVKLVESGIIRRWSLQVSQRYRQLVEEEGGVTYYRDDWYATTDGVIPLGMSHMQGIFLVVVIGYFFAAVAFAFEVLVC